MWASTSLPNRDAEGCDGRAVARDHQPHSPSRFLPRLLEVLPSDVLVGPVFAFEGPVFFVVAEVARGV